MHSSDPSRRAILKGKLASRQTSVDVHSIHVSSAIISVLPHRREEVLERLSRLPGVEIHHVESFKIVAVLEADDGGAIGSRLAEIATWTGVISANMVFEQAVQLSDIGEPT